jgi:hypothetical protein
MREKPSSIPAAIRSRLELASRISLRRSDAAPPVELPITSDGTTYTMAQEAVWLSERHFAVGRWDGSFSVFNFSDAPSAGPVITTAAANPAAEGLQMIVPIGHDWAVTSCDDASMAGWTTSTGEWNDLDRVAIHPFDSSLGSANSGRVVTLRDKKLLAVGHAHGFLSLWSIGRRFELTLGPIVDLRNPEPVNPWALHNIRGIAVLITTQQHGWIITGSEDGWMCVVRVPQGDVVSRSLYNADAERGINTISATNGGLLLVGNCSVGPEDSNLWYYVVRAGEWMPVLRDRANLRIDPEIPQVFNFSTIWIARHGTLSWCASTEEGALWMGTLTPDADRLRLLGYQDVTAQLGSALSCGPNGRLVMAGYDLHEFRLHPRA